MSISYRLGSPKCHLHYFERRVTAPSLPSLPLTFVPEFAHDRPHQFRPIADLTIAAMPMPCYMR
jgi:hypothetical protein